MARSLAAPLYERLLKTFPPTQAYTRADWDDDTMPDPVGHFLNHLLNHHSRREARRLRRARTDWVDYAHPEMESAVRTFFEAVKSHTRVPADEWEDALRRATRHATAHLVRPIHILTDFVYAEGEEPLPVSKILWRMRFFGPHAYLRKAVRAYDEKHDLTSLGPDRFEQFLYRIDERITDDYGADRWLRLIEPLFGIARRATGEKHVPASLLRAFFEEKGRTSIQQRLERYAEKDDTKVSPRTLHRLIEADEDEGRSAAPPETTPPRSETNQTPSSPRALPEEDAKEERKEIWENDEQSRSEQSAGTDDSTPLWQQFQQGRSQPESAGGTSEQADAQQDDQPLWARFQHDRDERLSDVVADDEVNSSPPSDADPPSEPAGTRSTNEGDASSPDAAPPSSASMNEASASLNELERQALGTTNPPHRAVYVRQLFEGDQSEYQAVLRRLANADNWNEASQIIASDVFRKHEVNIYSDAAVHFTNTVEDRLQE